MKVCRSYLTNFRIEKTCPHHVVEQIRIRINDDSGFQTFCVSCGEMVAWSTVTYERKVEGPVTKLSEIDKELLR